MVKLAYTQRSGRCGRKAVEVRLLSGAPAFALRLPGEGEAGLSYGWQASLFSLIGGVMRWLYILQSSGEDNGEFRRVILGIIPVFL